jgi:TRAP-type uncharacterized transport system substrate-binding protein
MNEADVLLRRFLTFLQRDARLRLGIGAVALAALLALAARSAYDLVPRAHHLTITGGEIVTDRHYLARILQVEAAKTRIRLDIHPASGSLDALQQVSDGKLDLALVHGGLTSSFANVEHVATIMPELVHLLARPGVASLADLRGKSINMGPRSSGGREIALTLAQFAGLAENVDYLDTSYSSEELLMLPARKLPDGILTISSTPSYLVEQLVREHHYGILPIPFPESLALRHGWARNGEILAYTYSIDPAIPDTNVTTVAVDMYLVANAKVDPVAIAKLLEVLYGPSVAAVMRRTIDDKDAGRSSGYPISAGVTAYLERDRSLFSMKNWKTLQGLFGMAMGFGGMGLILIKWFRGPPSVVESHDAELKGYLSEVAAIERATAALEMETAPDISELQKYRQRLGVLRGELLERYTKVNRADRDLFDLCITSVRASHANVGTLIAQASVADDSSTRITMPGNESAR